MPPRYPPPPTRFGPVTPSTGSIQPKTQGPAVIRSVHPPGPPAPAFATTTAPRGTMQRMNAAALNQTAHTTLYKIPGNLKGGKVDGLKNCQEVQVMSINGNFFISANTLDDTLTITKLSGHPIKGVDGCAKIAATPGTARVVLKGTGSKGEEVHAEQNLLHIIDHLLKDGSIAQVNGHIEVWGTKPPCGGCKRVLSAYADSLFLNYGVHLLFEGRSFENLRKDEIIDGHQAQVMTAVAQHTGQNVILNTEWANSAPEDVTFATASKDAVPEEYRRFSRNFTFYNKFAKDHPKVLRRDYAVEKLKGGMKALKENREKALAKEVIKKWRAYAHNQKKLKQSQIQPLHINANPQRRTECTTIARNIVLAIIVALLVGGTIYAIYNHTHGSGRNPDL